MKKRSAGLLLLGALLGTWVLSDSPRAQGNFVWQSSFNCADWDQSKGLQVSQVNCDGLIGYGAWTTSSGKSDQITAAANNPAGMGKGFRHWRGFGSGNNGGGLKIDLPNLKEMWVRWYMRYQTGFVFSTLNFTKDLYVNVASVPNLTLGFHGSDGWGVALINPGNKNLVGSPGWQSLNGGLLGDGRWHYYEVHLKIDTNGANGITESWADGQSTYRLTNVDFGTTGDWHHILIGSNQAVVANPTDVYTDYDDFAISTSGYIGPIGGGGSSSGPAAPTNLRITS